MANQSNQDQYRIPQGGQELYDNEHLYDSPDEQRIPREQAGTQVQQTTLKEHREAAPKYEELYTTAQENAVAFALISIAYLKEQGKTSTELIQSAGNRLAPSWQALDDRGAREFAQNIALNITALGGQPLSIEGDRTQAEVVFKDWIHVEHAKSFGLTREEADSWWEVFKPIAESMHLNYSWQRQGERIQIKVSR